jgi:Putative peptidoglycan binding domain/L,D-transpeptidase catalytic domain
MARQRSRHMALLATLVATSLIGCSSSSSNPDAGASNPITPPPAAAEQTPAPEATVAPTVAPTIAAVVAEPSAAPTEAPTTTAAAAPGETTIPAPPTETTLPVSGTETTVLVAAGTEPGAVAVETTVPVETVPPEPTTTTIDPYSLLTPAPPPAELIRAIGSLDGDGTRAVQQRLLDLHFWLAGVDGDYGHTTRQAVMAFQKYHLIPASGKVDQATADAMNLLAYMPRAVSSEGDIIEINKDLQVLFIVRGGQTQWILNTSTATGQTYEEPDRNTPGEIQRGTSITPSGLFRVNRERPDGWWEGDLGKIYRPKYFRGGVAVHGSGSIPNYPASHGCVRVSTQAMDMIWAENLMPLETPVWVYGSDPAQG